MLRLYAKAEKNVAECKALFETIDNNEKCQEKAKAWLMRFEKNPAQLMGYNYAGNMVMGPTSSKAPNKFDIEKSGRELDRKTQATMFSLPTLMRLGVFHGDRNA